MSMFSFLDIERFILGLLRFILGLLRYEGMLGIIPSEQVLKVYLGMILSEWGL